MKITIVSWILRLVAAGILLQTLFFKFTAAPESVYIFSTLGMEPFGRISSGVAELIAAVLLLIPRTTLLGALLSCGVMSGAIASHILILGYEVQNDGGTLFILALITFICSAALVFIHKKQISNLLKLKF
jgi:uncharacterized membrane protein YphA (DoxX/SURF4 family)